MLPMATTPEPPEDDRPAGPVPEDPAAQRQWAERFTDELLAHPGGIDAPWRGERTA